MLKAEKVISIFLSTVFILVSTICSSPFDIQAAKPILTQKTTSTFKPLPKLKEKPKATPAKPGYIVTYPVPDYIQLSNTYKVTVNGINIPVQKDGTRNFVNFSFAGTANIKITLSNEVVDYNLSPKSYNIQSTKNGKDIEFSLDTPRKLILWNANSSAEKLFILADPLEDNAPKLGDPNVINVMDYGVDNTGNRNASAHIQAAIYEASRLKGILYFPPGVYQINSKLTMKDDMTMYLSGGAYIRGAVNRSYWSLLDFSDTHNCKVIGRGVLDANGVGYRTISGLNMSDITVDGIILQRQYGDFHTWFQYATNLTVSNVKLVGEVRDSGNDGIDYDSCKNVLLNDNFVYSGDDCTSPKIYGGEGAQAQWQRDVENVNTVHMVGWVEGSGAGIKTFEAYGGKVLRNMTFEDIDIVNSATDAGVALYSVGGGGVEKVWLKNIRVEQLANKDNNGHRPLIMDCIDWNPWGSVLPAYIRDIYFKNVSFANMGTKNSRLNGRDDTHMLSNVTFDNLTMGGNLMMNTTEANMDIVNYTDNITFKNEEKPIVSIEAIKEHGGANQKGKFVIRRTGSTEEALTLPLLIYGTAINGVDYDAVPTEVTIPAGESSTHVKITPKPNLGNDKQKTVRVEIKNCEHSVAYLLDTDWRGVLLLNDVYGSYSQIVPPNNIFITPDANSPVIYWGLNEVNDDIIFDSSGNEISGQCQGGLNFTDNKVTGKFDSALSLDGVNDYIKGDNLNIGNSDFTLTTWVKTAQVNHPQSIFEIKSAPSTLGNIRVRCLIEPSSNSLTYGFAKYTPIPNSNPDIQWTTKTTFGTGITDGNWHQVALVFDRGGTVKLYIDGILKDDTLNISAFAAGNINGNFGMGFDQWSGNSYFAGTFDEVKVYKKVLSAGEIAQMGNLSILSPTTAAFDKKVANQADIGIVLTLNGNTLMSIKNGAEILNLGTDYILTSGGVTIKKEYLTTLAVGTNTITFEFNQGVNQNIIVTVSDSEVATEVITQKLYWKLDDITGTTATDGSGNNVTGSLQGGMSFDNNSVEGIGNKALSMDGTDDWINGGAVNLGTNDFTIATWIKAGNVSHTQGIVSMNGSTGGDTRVRIMLEADGKLNYGILRGDWAANWYSGMDIRDGSWHHIVVTFQRSGVASLYVDGVLKENSLDISSLSAGVVSGGVEVGHDTWTAAYLEGTIDEVKVYSKLLSPEEIAVLANIN